MQELKEYLSEGFEVHLRPVEEVDCELFYSWQTPQARRYFNNKRTPTRPEHQKWFRARLAEAQPRLWIVEVSETPVGYVRLDEHDRGDIWVSVLVEKAFQGRGIATAALRKLRAMLPEIIFLAEIHECNAPSRHAFVKAGYHEYSDRVMVSKP